MRRPQRDAAAELWNLMNALADSVLDATDDEITAETDNPQATIERTRAVLHNAERAVRQRRLANARSRYDERIASLAEQRRPAIPTTPDERKHLLATVLAGRPDLHAALTAQFREFSELSDQDVESYLTQLAALGVLDATSEDDE